MMSQTDLEGSNIQTPYEEPLDIEEFKDKINTRGGYFYGILQSELENSAKSMDDFTKELN